MSKSRKATVEINAADNGFVVSSRENYGPEFAVRVHVTAGDAAADVRNRLIALEANRGQTQEQEPER